MGYVEIAIEYWKRIGVEVTDIQQGEEAFIDSSVDAGDWHLVPTAGGLEVALVAVIARYHVGRPMGSRRTRIMRPWLKPS